MRLAQEDNPVAKRDTFLLRIDPKILEAIRRWADDDMRSITAQIEYLLRDSLRRAGRLPQAPSAAAEEPTAGDEKPAAECEPPRTDTD